MNKKQKEMIDKCIELHNLNLNNNIFDYIYMIPTRKKHDSGHKMMYIIGAIIDKDKNETLYLIDTYCDILEFGEYNKENHQVRIDIYDDDIIRFFNFAYKFQCENNGLSCRFSLIKK